MILGITGSTGFIGSALIRHFAARPELRLRCLVRHTPGWQDDLGAQIEFQRGDLQSPFDCAEFVRGIDVLVHLASASAPLTAGRSMPADVALSLSPTLNLLQAIKDHNPKAHIVYASSGGQVYGRSKSRLPWTEECPCQPVSIYGIHKLMSEHYLRLLAEESGVCSTILRIGNVYGDVLPPERLQGFIGVAVHELSHGRPVRLIGDAINVRDYVHLADVCRAFDLALFRREGYNTFNIGTGRGTSVDEILTLLGRISNREIPTLHSSPATNSASLIPWNVLNASKAHAAGWTPSITLENGLKRLLDTARWP